MVSRIVLVIIASVFIVCEFVHGGNSGGVADDYSVEGYRKLLGLLNACLQITKQRQKNVDYFVKQYGKLFLSAQNW
uniref:Secreted protein n=1 Tax=Trichobilharzia regenti TaxID=157069 RepID=A0AA85J569_TRIRE|nr:unnamed protein product [Trichobilharzia regenti]